MAMQANVASSTPDSMGGMTSPTSPTRQFFPGETPSRPTPVLYHLLVNMRAFVGSICSSANEGVELSFVLYTRHEHHFLSEPFIVNLNHNGVPAGPRPEDLVGRVQTLFTDLTSKDIGEEIYLVCRIFRTGEGKDVLTHATANATPPKDQSRSSALFDMTRPLSGGTNRAHKSTSSVIRPKGARVSQIFSRSSSPEAPNSTNPLSKTTHSSNPSTGKASINKGSWCRKPFGCSVLDLSRIFHESPTSNSTESGTDHVMPIFVASQEHDFYCLHERIIESKTNKLYFFEMLI